MRIMDTTSETAKGSHALRLWFCKRIGGFVELARKLKFQSRTAGLVLKESVALGERRSLVVVRWGDRQYLIGLTSQSLAVLDTRLDKTGRSENCSDLVNCQ